jgi:hypothetical protein
MSKASAIDRNNNIFSGDSKTLLYNNEAEVNEEDEA